MDTPGFQDLFAIARNEILARSKLLSLDAVERDGTDANVLLAAGAATDDEVMSFLVAVAARLFLDSATGQDLDRLVFDRYGLVRKPAAPALGSVTFSSVIGAGAAFPIPVGTLLSTSSGLQFKTIQPATFPVGIGPLTVMVQSTLAGLNQQAAVGTITSLSGSLPGQPTDLAVTNALATAGADDAETDQSLRDRARRFFLDARRGTLQAIEDQAIAIPGVRTANAIEVIDVSGRPARLVQLIISDAFTSALVQQNVNPPQYMAQSSVLGATVFAGLSDTRACGIFVQVIVAQVVFQPITLQLRFRAGANVDLVALIARATVVAAVNALSPGQTMSIAALEALLKTVNGLDWQGNEIVSPAGDVVPAVLQVMRTSLDICLAQALQTSSSPNAVLASTTNPDNFVSV